jgi:hypothetical protein
MLSPQSNWFFLCALLATPNKVSTSVGQKLRGSMRTRLRQVILPIPTSSTLLQVIPVINAVFAAITIPIESRTQGRRSALYRARVANSSISAMSVSAQVALKGPRVPIPI